MAQTMMIKKSINRKVSTAAYESIDVNVEMQEEITWETEEERIQKTDYMSKMLIIDLIKTLRHVTSELQLNKKQASIKSPDVVDTSNILNNNNSDDNDVSPFPIQTIDFDTLF